MNAKELTHNWLNAVQNTHKFNIQSDLSAGQSFFGSSPQIISNTEADANSGW